MALSLFGVTATTVQTDCFPHWTAFSSTSKPSSSSVGRYVDEEAGDLAGRLLAENISAATVHALGATEAPYVWCRKTLTLMTAVRVCKASTARDPELAQSFQRELDARFKRLDAIGQLALGSDTLNTDTSEADGPHHHVDEYDMDTSDDATNASSVEPELRREDEL